VIDYKTGHGAKGYAIDFRKLDPADRRTWSTAVGSLQLPLYLMLDGSASDAMFLLLGRTRLSRSIELPLFREPGEAERELPRIQAVILGVLKEIVSPDVPFAPAVDRKRVCPTCDFNGICGTRWLK